jgi:hypothetical protein
MFTAASWQQLETVHQYPYLGVELSEDLAWEPHINKVISKANVGLSGSSGRFGQVRWNVYGCFSIDGFIEKSESSHFSPVFQCYQ